MDYYTTNPSFLRFLISLIILYTTLHTIPQISAVGYPINVWPQPITFQWPQPQAIAISPNFAFSAPPHRYLSAPPHRYLSAAVRCYFRQIQTEHHYPLDKPQLNLTSAPPLTDLIITIFDFAAPLTDHDVNESYSLTAPCDGGAAELDAGTPWGAMRGLETFSQQVYSNSSRVMLYEGKIVYAQ